MLFHLRIANAAGPLTTLPTVFASAKDAINTACATLQLGAPMPGLKMTAAGRSLTLTRSKSITCE